MATRLPPSSLRALADGLQAFVDVVRAAADAATTDDPQTIVPLTEAARIAGTSTRVLRDAIRAGDLPAYGKQRDRGVRRADLDQWVESRKINRAPHVKLDEGEMARRVRLIELQGTSKVAK